MFTKKSIKIVAFCIFYVTQCRQSVCASQSNFYAYQVSDWEFSPDRNGGSFRFELQSCLSGPSHKAKIDGEPLCGIKEFEDIQVARGRLMPWRSRGSAGSIGFRWGTYKSIPSGYGFKGQEPIVVSDVELPGHVIHTINRVDAVQIDDQDRVKLEGLYNRTSDIEQQLSQQQELLDIKNKIKRAENEVLAQKNECTRLSRNSSGKLKLMDTAQRELVATQQALAPLKYTSYVGGIASGALGLAAAAMSSSSDRFRAALGLGSVTLGGLSFLVNNRVRREIGSKNDEVVRSKKDHDNSCNEIQNKNLEVESAKKNHESILKEFRERPDLNRVEEEVMRDFNRLKDELRLAMLAGRLIAKITI